MRRIRRTTLLGLTIACVLGLSGLTAAHAEEGTVSFEDDIAPIFENRCTYCHGEDEQEAGLRLDRRGHMLRGGDSGLPTIVPGQPEKSYLLEVVGHRDPVVKMPPDEDKIPQDEIDLLTRWIEQGANWPGQMDATAEQTLEHWAFLPVQRPEVPDAASDNANPIDRFLQARLKAEGLSFSEAAEPRALLRRVSIVLTGLPPTPEQAERFLVAWEQNSEVAYTTLVDDLLASPHFGERWAQHWLDVIRWAETNGSEANLYRKNAWIYRDYVIRAFNEDKPYDEFVREQLAGDTLGTGEATGFLVSGPHVPAATVGREPSAIRQARADRMDEVMQTVGASIMGVTLGCARCHNHKFDPISIKDYYAMTGVFQDVEFGSRQPELSADHPRKQRGREIWRQIAAERSKLREFGGWEENWGAYRELHFKPVTTEAIRVRFKMKNVSLDELEVFGLGSQFTNVAAANQGARLSGFPEKGFEGRNPIDRLNDSEYGTMVWRAKTEKGEENPWVRIDFNGPKNIHRLRLSSNREYYFDTDYLTKKPWLPRYEYDVDILGEDGEWKPWVGTWVVNKKLNESHPEREQMLASIQKQIDLIAEEGPRPSFIGRFIEPPVTRVLLRGSPENPRDEVFPAGPELFDGDLGLTSDTPGPKRRAEFAEWLTRKENPLTSRVMVNRLWHHVFGSGIVVTTSDFGEAGAEPTHPELLDWLAAEFYEPTLTDAAAVDHQPWNVKRMIRLMVMSQAFRQSSLPREDALAIDSDSALLWRFPPKRVEAEVIRDAILQASGNLDRSLGGRSYRIHNEKDTYAQWQVVDNHGSETWRRMIYQERMRRVDDQMFTPFDFPDCGQVRAKRPVSTTPLQALNLMNSDFVIEQSKLIADRATQESHSDSQAIERVFALLLNRQPSRDELETCLEVANEIGLNMVCRAVMNSNEFVFLP
ncbi:PSD1 and planctomycete cytochrome C domain-containing protein [Rubinisphaera sp. JC750]|uniref:PSD1 and planctomycete cytochrome C domain-containing protein n=1 Tax=Rubinisphaera sp. JC750 TaxID=2898658 RepID=UPI001F1AF845|nr:PSD1 and planctomycete cytochrome C domain-containing protein [Rubinisphaera sp. JC750]